MKHTLTQLQYRFTVIYETPSTSSSVSTVYFYPLRAFLFTLSYTSGKLPAQFSRFRILNRSINIKDDINTLDSQSFLLRYTLLYVQEVVTHFIQYLIVQKWVREAKKGFLDRRYISIIKKEQTAQRAAIQKERCRKTNRKRDKQGTQTKREKENTSRIGRQ